MPPPITSALLKRPLSLSSSSTHLLSLALIPLLFTLAFPNLSPVVVARAATANQTLVSIAVADLVAVRAVFAAFPPSVFSWFAYFRFTPEKIYGPDGAIAFCCSANCDRFFPLRCTAQGRITAIFTGHQLGYIDLNTHYAGLAPSPDPAEIGSFGTLSPAVGDLPELLSLSLADSRLAGEIPPSISRLQNLTALVMNGNNFSGPVPRAIFRLSALRVLDLSRNNLTGELPGAAAGEAEAGAGVGAWYSPQLEELVLRSNRLAGSVPSAVAQMTALTRLDLGENALSGGIPKELRESLTRLEVARLDFNQLGGPFCHAMLPATEVYLGFNNFSHEPNAFHGCQLPARVMLLSAPYAGLRGTVPADAFLHVNESGRSPWQFSPRNWTAFWVYSDALDRWSYIGDLRWQDGLHLNLSHNSLSGSLTAFSVPDFYVLDLSYNSFTGRIPEILFTSFFQLLDTDRDYVIQNRMLDVRFNQLSGPITKWWLKGLDEWHRTMLNRLRVSNNSAHMATAVPSGCLPPHSPEIPASAAETAALVAVRDALLGMREGEAVKTHREPEVDWGENWSGTWWQAMLESWDPERSSACGWYGVGCTADGHVDTLHILGDQSVMLHYDFVPYSPDCGFDQFGSWACAEPVPVLPRYGRRTAVCMDGLSKRNGSLSAALGQLTHLTSLRISNHTLSGSLPHSLSLLSNLVFLDLSGNQHLSGPIPTSLYAFPSLVELHLGGNSLTGAFLPTDSSSNGASLLSAPLESVDVGGNALSGSIPGSIGGLTSLCRLVVDHCGLEGTLPRQLGALWMLRELQLQGNALQGDLSPLAARYNPSPAAAADPGVPALWGLGGVFPLLSRPDLSSNQLTGDLKILSPFPPPLIFFNASFNRLTGTIPRVPLTADVYDRAAFVDLSHNRLSGSIPAALSAHYLRLYDVSYNQLSTWANGSAWRGASGVRLDVSHNELRGELPRWIVFEHVNASWNSLTSFHLDALTAARGDSWSLDLSHNKISTSLPTLSSCSSCSHLDLSYNLLSANILTPIASATPYLTHLNLRGNLLSGTLPLWLTQAPALLHLDLSRNQLKGSLPAFCGKQQQLHTLLLSNNSFSGSLDSLLSCSTCSHIDLSYNLLSSNILPQLATATSYLTHLNLRGNLLSGTLPLWLTEAPALLHLDLSHNRLSGAIPAVLSAHYMHVYDVSYNQLSTWTNGSASESSSGLRLDVSHNELTGEFAPWWIQFEHVNASWNGFTSFSLPAFVSSGGALLSLDLSNNRISGSLPTLSCSSCSHIDLSYNLLSGSIPSQLATATPDLTHLDLRGNLLSGTLPLWLTQAPALLHLDLSHNQLNGSLPAFCGNQQQLHTLLLSNNSISGSLAPLLSSCASSLLSLEASNNQLSGSLPPLSACSTCNHVDLSYNLLSGTILPQLATATPDLTHLDLRGNLLSGTLPLWLTQAPALLHLDLSRNQLKGSLPAFCGNQQQLGTLLLSVNSFSGSLTRLLSSSSCASSLLSLNVSNNQISGSLPKSVSLFTALRFLIAARNRISSSIPAALSSLKSLRAVDLSWNGLSGAIPPLLGGGNQTASLDVSLAGNALSGSVPRGLSDLPQSAFRPGNPKLCGLPLPVCKPSKPSKGKCRFFC